MTAYSPEMRERSLRMLAEAAPDHPNRWTAIRHVARLLGMSPETLRLWQRKVEVDAGERSGATSEAAEEIELLKRENAELRRANGILKSASVFFRQGTRPSHDEMIRYIEQHKDQFGAEAICRVLRPASARQLRDDLLVPEIVRLHAENYGVYGRRKMHALLRRQG